MGGLLPTAEVFEEMQPTRVMLSFAAADGGLHLARDLRSLLLEQVDGWPVDEPEKPAQQAYLDSINLQSKPGSVLKDDGTTGNGHWAEFYLMGTLCAHTVVLIIDGEHEASRFCQGELDSFLENCRRARSFLAQPEPEPRSLGSPPSAERFPGSEFDVVVVYEQPAVFVGSEGAAKLADLRMKLEATGMVGRCSFYLAWFSCFGPGAIVNKEAAVEVEALRPAWEAYAEQTDVQKADRERRVRPPRIPASFAPHGIVCESCAKDDGRHWSGMACPECAAARRQFVGEVQAAEGRFGEGTAVGTPEDYCALYDRRWRRQAWELQGRVAEDGGHERDGEQHVGAACAIM
jgi:hypothetical protein